jgi:hypothetical protein
VIQYPGHASYPNDTVWADFNRTLSGALVTPDLQAETGRFEIRKDVRACNLKQRTYWSDPVLIQSPWWGGFGCPTCPSGYATATCSLGNHPNIVVRAQSAKEVSEAINFANQWNLRVVVKNTGHDFLGR